MKLALAAAAAFTLLPLAAFAATVHIPAGGPAPGGAAPAFSASVMAGDTLYVSGMLDRDPSGRMGSSAEESAKLVLDQLKAAVEKAGLTMDDLVWVQIFATDLGYYAKFNEAYRTYFKGPLPARAFVGTSQLLNGAHFEIMGVAVKAR